MNVNINIGPESTEALAARDRIVLVRTRSQFDALECQWKSLFERAGRAPHLFQSYDWLWHWANNYLSAGTSVCLVTGWHGPRLTMVWPLVEVRAAGFSKLCWMGQPVSPYGDVLVEQGADSADLLAKGWRAVLSLDVDVIDLRGIRSDASIAPTLVDAGMALVGSTFAPSQNLERLLCRQAPEQARTRASASIRRRLRRLSELGSIQFEQSSDGSLVDEALTMKRTWAAAEGLISRTIFDSRFEQFLRETVESDVHPVGGRLSTMRMNGRPIAVDISYGSRDRVFGHFLTYDASFRKFGPGILMADFSIRAAQEQGYKVFDLCPPEQPYKLQMCDQRVEVCEWARALSGKGKLIVWLRRWRLRQAAKMAFRYVPRRMRQLLSSLYARGK